MEADDGLFIMPGITDFVYQASPEEPPLELAESGYVGFFVEDGTTQRIIVHPHVGYLGDREAVAEFGKLEHSLAASRWTIVEMNPRQDAVVELLTLRRREEPEGFWMYLGVWSQGEDRHQAWVQLQMTAHRTFLEKLAYPGRQYEVSMLFTAP